MWEVENIPDDDFVFMRAHKNYFPEGDLIPGVFCDHDGGMSTDWEKYSTPEQTRNRARSPKDNGVVRLNAGGIRSIKEMTLVHEPEIMNRAHSEVFGDKTPEARLKLKRLAEWAIKI